MIETAEIPRMPQGIAGAPENEGAGDFVDETVMTPERRNGNNGIYEPYIYS
jgi:hypothetical protein